MTSSHAAGWASDAPTPGQLKEFYDQITSGRVTRSRLNSFLEYRAEPASIFVSETFLVDVYHGAEAIERHCRDLGRGGRIEFLDPSVNDTNFPQGPYMNKWTDKGKALKFLYFGRRLGRLEAAREIERAGFGSSGAAEVLALALKFPDAIRGADWVVGLGQWGRFRDTRNRDDEYVVAASFNRNGLSIAAIPEGRILDGPNVRFVVG